MIITDGKLQESMLIYANLPYACMRLPYDLLCQHPKFTSIYNAPLLFKHSVLNVEGPVLVSTFNQEKALIGSPP